MPSIAPLVAAFRRRLSNLPGPAPAATGETASGLPVQVELLLGGVWMDITATSSVLVRDDSGNIRVTYGITGGEGSQTDRAQAVLQLRNTDGRFTPRNPTGPYYGQIGRNTPMRISVPDGAGGKSYRMWGQVTDWAPNADLSGEDVWTDTTVSGILQALAQAPVPDHSVIYNAILDPAPPGLLAYWPMEDPSGSVQLASALTSGSPMTWTGTPTLASYEGFSASDPLPDISTASLSGGVGKYDDPTATQVRFLAYIPKAGMSDGKVLCAIDQTDYSAGSAQFWELYYSTTDATNSLVLRTCASDGTVLGAILPHTLDVRGRLLYVSVELQESGTSITRQVQLKDVLTSRVYAVSDTETLTQLTRVTKVQFGVAARAVSGPAGSATLPGVTVGHATVENAITAIDALGTRLNTIGETAGRRIQRLCGEQGIPFDWIGDLDDTAAMGAQPRQNLLAHTQEACLADGGLLYENRAVLGLGYRTRASLYNQGVAITLSWSGGQLAEQTPSPVDDDRYTQNTLTVTVGGVSATYTQTDGPLGTDALGAYGEDKGLTLNLASTDTPTLLDQAAWRVHLGTVDEARFPQVSVNLAHPSITPDMRRAILNLRLGDRMQIPGVPTWLPPDTIDQLVLGMDETITHFEHRITFTCAPASPYSSIGFLDAADCRIDIDSQLLNAVGSSDTSLLVVPDDGEVDLWTTDPAETPWDVRAGGEVMRVTAVSPYILDTFARSVSSSWGSADTGQAWTTSGGSASDYSVGSGAGVLTLPLTLVRHLATIPAPRSTQEAYVDVAAAATATGDSMYGGLALRAHDTQNHYVARLEFLTTGALTFKVWKRVGGTETLLGTYVPSNTYTPGTFYRIHFRVENATVRAAMWAVADADMPRSWFITATDTDRINPMLPSSAESVGVLAYTDGGNTNVNPQIKFQNFKLVDTQTMTVTRSINGVVKAQAAGEHLSLANPTIISL